MLSLFAQLFICQAISWTAPLTLDANNRADGTVEVQCEAQALRGGTVEQLYKLMELEIRDTASIRREWDDEVKGAKGKQFEASWIVKRGGETLAMSGYLGVWRTETSFFFDAHSKDVTGTGPAKNIKELYPSLHLETNDHGFSVHFRTRLVVEKPGAVPKKKFLEIVKREAEDEIKASEAEWIAKFQETL